MERHFTKLVKANGRLREFNFRKLLSTTPEELYHVDVCDDRGTRIIFKIQEEGGGWKIVPQDLPAWIFEVEEKINEVLKD